VLGHSTKILTMIFRLLWMIFLVNWFLTDD
jgi:hypothetical protein